MNSHSFKNINTGLHSGRIAKSVLQFLPNTNLKVPESAIRAKILKQNFAPNRFWTKAGSGGTQECYKHGKEAGLYLDVQRQT